MKLDHPILALCANLEVSPSGYYDWQKRRTPPGPRALQNQTLAKQIAGIHIQSRNPCGRPRSVGTLRKQGARHGRNRVARRMRAAGLCGRQKGRDRGQTTASNQDHPSAPNLMAQAPAAAAPNQIWVGDSTYIETPAGWLYLAAIRDRYRRKIVGWAMRERSDPDLVRKAFALALRHRQPTAKGLFHSARGVQSASANYRRALTQAGWVASMSRKGNGYDHATMESFWRTRKLELVCRRHFATRSQARSQSFDDSESFYNRQRAQSALGAS